MVFENTESRGFRTPPVLKFGSWILNEVHITGRWSAFLVVGMLAFVQHKNQILFQFFDFNAHYIDVLHIAVTLLSYLKAMIGNFLKKSASKNIQISPVPSSASLPQKVYNNADPI